MRLRAATESDFPELTRIRGAGIRSYTSFAPEGWEPPDENEHIELVSERMRAPERWVTVAEDDDGAVLGYVAASPALSGWGEGEPIEGTAYLWMLFVDPPHQGRGVGRLLQDSAFDEMRRRGYSRALVRMAEGADSCAFYAATGWTVIDRSEDEILGLPLLVAERGL